MERDAQDSKAPASSWYALVVLLVATLLGAVDRVMLSLQTEPMRVSLSLSDTQLGLLQGAALMLFTGIATLPLGWLSDRCDRRIVLAACVLLWSAATGLRGTAQVYGVLFISCVGLGVGEAGISPVVLGMIPDLFSRTQRVLANTAYSLAALFGNALGAMLGSSIMQMAGALQHLLPDSMQTLEPWRLTSFFMALLGVPVALLVLSIRKVSPRGHPTADPAASVASRAAARATDNAEFRRHLRTHWRTFAGLVTGIGLANVGLSLTSSWIPVSIARSFGLTPEQLGQGVGLAYLAGTVGGGALGYFMLRAAQRRVGPPAALRVMMGGNVAAALLSILLLFTRSGTEAFMALGLLAVPLIAGMMALPSLLQDASPPQFRGRTLALLTVAVLPFYVLGPLVIGMLSDVLKSSPDGLAIAIVATILVGGFSGALVLRATEGSFVRLMRASHTDV